jgi:arylsulfatase A-like enzyme
MYRTMFLATTCYYLLLLAIDTCNSSQGHFCPQAGNNAPLRGHKAELFEGGIRNNALIYSKSTKFVPTAMRGSSYDGGLVHVMDWHAAFAKISGSTLQGFELDGNEKVGGLQV